MLIIKVNPNFLKTDAYKIVRSAARQYIAVLEEGIRTREFREDIQPYLVRAMIWGTIEHMVTRKSLLGNPADLIAMADDIYQTFFHGIRHPAEPADVRVKLELAKTPNANEEGL
jgi:hypothetical protein